METSKHNKLSVVVLSFNTPTLTKQTLQSVSLSDHTSLELICVDDGSRPEAVEELASYCRTNGITFLSNGKNRGIPASCNIGLQAATGEFISVIGDDLVLPRRYSDDVQILSENFDCGFVCSQVSLIDEANTPLLGFESWTNPGVEGRFLETPEKILLRGSKALTPTLTFRTALLRAIGGWDEEYLIEDKPLLIKLAKLKVAGYFYARQSTLYRRYSGNLTGRFRTSAYAEDLALLKQYDLKVSLGSFQFKCFIESHHALLNLNSKEEEVRAALKDVSFPVPHWLVFSFPAKLLFYVASLFLSRGFTKRNTRSYLLG